MAVLDHHEQIAAPNENACAIQFCLTWVGFFALIGLVTWIVSLV